MRRFAWIYVLLFIVVLLMTIFFFRGAWPIVPQTEAPEENAGGLRQEQDD